ncbi:MAG: AAA family ATPase [Holosporales bacterium]|jgi:DNA replication and repair protein RecF|nr:AAA family ATPase [Holosporales bacterium]
MIKYLRINNFRNYNDVRLDIDSNIVVLYGENGAGKTNVLEAISTFSETNGLRRSKYEEMILSSDEKRSSWNAVLSTESAEFSSGYTLGEKYGKRIYKVGDKSVRNLSEFLKENYILWLTYETDRLFMQSPSSRRDFIDMFCCVQDRIHNSNLRNYEKLARERLKILKKSFDNGLSSSVSSWLDIVESKLADYGLKISKNRIATTKTLEKGQLQSCEFPKFQNKMTGALEDDILGGESDSPLDHYRSELRNRRQKDFFSGITTFGPNRSDWKVCHKEKQIAAFMCSAGEQKMLLSGVFLAFVISNMKNDDRNLILLLDDVIAHLDAHHRNLIFGYIRSLVGQNSDKISTWLSGTDKNLFGELSDQATFYNVHDNCIRKC